MRTASIGELTSPVKSWNPSRDSDRKFEYIDLGAVDNSSKTVTNAIPTVGSDAPSRARQLVADGDILVSTVRPNLNAVAVVPPHLDGATASTGFTVLRPTAEIDGRFLFHWVRSKDFIDEMVRRATGASYPAVSDRIVKESLIPTPPLPEQRRLAAILDHADALRAKRRQVLTHLDSLVAATFVERFDTYAETPALGESLSFITSGGRGWAKYYAPVGDRFIQSLDVQMGSISTRDPVFVTPPDNAESRRTRTRVGDVLLTITGSRIGRAAALPDCLAGAYVSQHVAILRPDPELMLPEFLAAMLALPSLGQQLIAGAQYGQTKPGLNFEQIRAFALPRPPLSDQQHFVQHVHQIAEQRELMVRAGTCSDQLFSSLQARAFRGEL